MNSPGTADSTCSEKADARASSFALSPRVPSSYVATKSSARIAAMKAVSRR
jgi:hypothetical protein